MKKLIILTLFLITFYSESYAGLCVTGKHYIIVKYSNSNSEFSIKGNGIYDKFLNGPFIKSKNLTNIGVHYINNPFCNYKNFELINKLKIKDLKTIDKKIFLGNIFLSILFFIIPFLLFYKYSRNKI